MQLIQEFKELLKEHGYSDRIHVDMEPKFERLIRFCPVYRDYLRRHPEDIFWLEKSTKEYCFFHNDVLELEWEELQKSYATKWSMRALRQFRRKMTMRIAYNELNQITNIEQSIAEISILADFCVQTVSNIVQTQMRSKYGTPWDDNLNKEARYCVLGLGKVGGHELNFCSDLDLIFFYEGEGVCRKNDKETQLGCAEFFNRMARDIAAKLQERDVEGFCYNIDVRLRPEGDSGPLVRSLSSMENYYFTAGQTWERLALSRARIIAGDHGLAHDLLESLTSFIYPRTPPNSLAEQIAGVKLRIEKEILSQQEFERDIKTGYGGIREIEFFAQTLQILHAGKNPFLQTTSTLHLLSLLERYNLIKKNDYTFLREAYLFLRSVENKLQMREERQMHCIPEDAYNFESIARMMKEPDRLDFAKKLKDTREKVREIYASILSINTHETLIQNWSCFLSGQKATEDIELKIKRWFWGDSEKIEKGLRHLAFGPTSTHLTRENVLLFMALTDIFDEALPPLSHPLETIHKVNRFADKYGARKHFLKMCTANPRFFNALCRMFDRSNFIYKIACAHPEIMDELLLTGLRLNKSKYAIQQEIEALRQSDDIEFMKSVWLFTKAEQVRLAIAGVLKGSGPAAVEAELSALADVVLTHTLARIDPEHELQILALGKYGGQEIAFGSDLDLIILRPSGSDLEKITKKVQRFMKLLSHKTHLGRTYDIDLRLRPYGNDGPLASSVNALSKYHSTNGAAKIWERQTLLRSRIVKTSMPMRGSKEIIRKEFKRFRKKLLFSAPAEDSVIQSIYEMRKRVEVEKARSLTHKKWAFKTGAGGLLDIEFLCQAIQLRFGKDYRRIRLANTRKCLHEIVKSGLISHDHGIILLDNYNFLRKLEFLLRRIDNEAISVIEEDPNLHHSITLWLGFMRWEVFEKQYEERVAQTRAIYNEQIQNLLASNIVI